MPKGSVVSIQVALDAKGAMQNLPEVRAVEGKGLEGDRYCNEVGSYSHNPGPDREVTLIEAEAVEAMERDYGTALDSKDSRRNVTTRGVPLNHLVQREFSVGAVKLRGLVHRGGLRAQVLTGGMIRVGDPVEWDESPA